MCSRPTARIGARFPAATRTESWRSAPIPAIRTHRLCWATCRRLPIVPVRIRRPAVRRGWLEGERPAMPPEARCGRVCGSQLARRHWISSPNELRRVYAAPMAPSAVFGGSYGWASAGRFHHAQSQVHRFLQSAGRLCRDPSTPTVPVPAMVIIPHVLGPTTISSARASPGTPSSAQHRPGRRLRRHGDQERRCPWRRQQPAYRAGRFRVPARAAPASSWSAPLPGRLPVRSQCGMAGDPPGTDVALMLGLAHVLVTEGLHDRGFLDSLYGRLRAFRGLSPRPDRWCAEEPGMGLRHLRHRRRGSSGILARAMARSRTLVTVSHSLQRADYGEQPVWMGIVLAAMLGQIGLDGGGYSYSLGALGQYRQAPARPFPLPTLRAVQESGRGFHSCRAHRRHAAQSGRARSTITARR